VKSFLKIFFGKNFFSAFGLGQLLPFAESRPAESEKCFNFKSKQRIGKNWKKNPFFCNNIFQKPNLFFKGKTFVMKFELFSNRSISQSYLLASLFSLFETCFVIFKSKCPHQLCD
jgi:hypothetical protein